MCFLPCCFAVISGILILDRLLSSSSAAAATTTSVVTHDCTLLPPEDQRNWQDCWREGDHMHVYTLVNELDASGGDDHGVKSSRQLHLNKNINPTKQTNKKNLKKQSTDMALMVKISHLRSVFFCVGEALNSSVWLHQFMVMFVASCAIYSLL